MLYKILEVIGSIVAFPVHAFKWLGRTLENPVAGPPVAVLGMTTLWLMGCLIIHLQEQQAYAKPSIGPNQIEWKMPDGSTVISPRPQH